MKKKLIVTAATVAALGAGAVGAVAAGSSDKAAEDEVLADAAKRLGVNADDLRSALSKAEDAQLEAQVKAGTLTQAQADAIKQHRAQEGTVLDLDHGGRGGPGDHHHGGGRFLMSDAAKAIGISEDQLFTQLRGGKTLEQIAKANGKALADVKAAVKKRATVRLDADLKAGRITQAQHDDEVAELDDEIARLGDVGTFAPDGDHHDHGAPPASPGPNASPTP
jgi:hypothetical protein